MRKRVKILSVIFAAAMTILTGCAQVNLNIDEGDAGKNNVKESHVYEIEKKTMPMYMGTPEEKMDFEFAFLDGVGDVPYVSIDTAVDILTASMDAPDSTDYSIALEKEGETVTLERESGYPAKIVFDEDYIEFWDYDGFFRKTDDDLLIDDVDFSYFTRGGKPRFLKLMDSFERYGVPVTVNAGDHGIDLVHQDDGYYIPLQLLSDIFLFPYGGGIIFNGSAAYLGGGGNYSQYDDLFYNEDYPKQRSSELAEFNYNEFCLAMDLLYGLKDQHNITTFDDLYMETGLKEAMLSRDPLESTQALYESVNVYLDDLHSGFVKNIYVERKRLEEKRATSLYINGLDNKRFSSARAQYYGEDVPGYEEVGNTAYITFDEFVFEDVDYYTEDAKDHLDDTMGLMIYSFEQITRDNSPIENVVLDLSNNYGGAIRTAAYTIGMFIGEGSISLRNSASNALVTENFRADLNLDGEFDDNDTLRGKYNLICLTSPLSFSCGNLVPSVLKNSHEVITMGQTSGGGTCSVQYLTTADGSIIQMSGPRIMSYTKNGSFYEIDRGVEPDYVIPTAKQFYDRKTLTDQINNILGN